MFAASALWCFTLRTVPEKIIPELRTIRTKPGNRIVECEAPRALPVEVARRSRTKPCERTQTSQDGGQRSDGSSQILQTYCFQNCDACHSTNVTYEHCRWTKIENGGRNKRFVSNLFLLQKNLLRRQMGTRQQQQP